MESKKKSEVEGKLRNMTLVSVAECCGGKLHPANADLEKCAAGVVIDSKKAEKDYIFIATKGERVDGHSFIPQVMEKGALAVVCEREPEDESVPYILVEDSFQALKDIAEYYRKQLSVRVVGITGSVGKTSTKEFIAGVLSQKYRVLKTEGNFNNEVGLPLTVLQIRQEHEVAVLEMGISHFGEMHRLSKIARPDVCVMTNIGQCHLEFLGTREGILKAKSEIFDFADKDAAVFVNGDDDMLVTVPVHNGKAPIHFGMSEKNDAYVTDIENRGLFGSEAKIHLKGMEEGTEECFAVSIPLPGEHMVYNALAAASVAKYMGLTIEQIQTGISAVKPVGGRSNIIRADKYTLIDDCYNANPVSMEAAIDLLNMALTRKVAVLGDMFELGENSDALHERIGKYAVEHGVDMLLCVGENSRFMYEAALKKKEELGAETKLYYFAEQGQLEEVLENLLEEKDTILIKASHSMEFENVVKKLSQ